MDENQKMTLEKLRELGDKVIECRELLRAMETVQKDGVLLLVQDGLDVGTIAAYARLQPFEVLSIVNESISK